MRRQTAFFSRWTSFAAVSSLFISLLLGPIQSAIWNGAKAPGWVLHWVPWSGAMLSWQKNSFELSSYYFFGRFFFLTYIGCLLALWGVSRLEVAGRILQKHRFFRLLFVGLLVGLLGDLTAYWGGGWWGAGVRFVGFWLTEVPALVVSLVAMVGLGFTLRASSGLRVLGWSLLGVFPLALVYTGLLRYMPHGPMTALCLGCVGVSLGLGAKSAEHAHAHTKAPGHDETLSATLSARSGR